MSISRKTILSAIVIAVILATIPSAIRRIVRTGELYLFSQHFFHDVAARLSGPGRFRFILQPSMAILLGARVKDSRTGSPPFLWGLFSTGNGGQN